jgi:hypothetical protein
MRARAIDLREFYDTMQGRVVQRILRQHIRALWQDARGLRVMGLGYGVPYLKSFLGEASATAALMPGRIGAVYWPEDGKGLVCMCHESDLPVEANSVDRLLMIHAPGDAESMDAMLRECWRVLAGQGRLIWIAPNRTGIWARMDNTPFGRGTPWSMGQMRQTLKDNLFVPERTARALFVPPSSSPLLLATAGAWEKVGQKFFNAFGGVNIMEASKQLYAAIPAPATTAAQALAARGRMIAKPVIIPERIKGV